MNTQELKNYLDATFLLTVKQLEITKTDYQKLIEALIVESIEENFKLVMLRPDQIAFAKKMISNTNTKLLIGTVIDFPKGISNTELKMAEALRAIQNGADELDFVCNYKGFQAGLREEFKEQIYLCTKLGLEHHKTVKWIIEIAALSEIEIVQITSLIKQVVVANFKEDQYPHVFVKSSTGFYKTKDNLPNGATIPAIVSMLENAFPLSVKASGGIRTYEEALTMINLGVKRIGTSNAKKIISGQVSENNY